VDHYAVLGVGRSADLQELRRAYRALALRHHPDVAGNAATELFQRIVEAYRVLSDGPERQRYDQLLRAAERGLATAARRARSRADADAPSEIIVRLSGALEQLVARGIARRVDGTVELFLTADEAARGGVVALDAVVPVACPTCSGLAARGHVWCRRCEFEGTVLDEVTVWIPIPPLARDGVSFAVAADPLGVAPPLRVRLRV
jgi:molecular chaperone DnaJ